jgi:hypothetical protein
MDRSLHEMNLVYLLELTDGAVEEFLEPASIFDWHMPKELVPHLGGSGGDGGKLIENEQNAYAMTMAGPRVV